MGFYSIKILKMEDVLRNWLKDKYTISSIVSSKSADIQTSVHIIERDINVYISLHNDHVSVGGEYVIQYADPELFSKLEGSINVRISEIILWSRR